MEIFLIMIPFMVLAVAIAVVPLLWAMSLQEEGEYSAPVVEWAPSERNQPMAA